MEFLLLVLFMLFSVVVVFKYENIFSQSFFKDFEDFEKLEMALF